MVRCGLCDKSGSGAEDHSIIYVEAALHFLCCMCSVVFGLCSILNIMIIIIMEKKKK